MATITSNGIRPATYRGTIHKPANATLKQGSNRHFDLANARQGLFEKPNG